MSEKEMQEKGAQILEVFAMAGKKESLTGKIKEQNVRISGNNAKVADLQKEMDADNMEAQGVIGSLSKELDEVKGALDTLIAVLEKEGYKLPIGKKASKTISM